MGGGGGKGGIGHTGPPSAKNSVMNASITSGGDVNIKMELTYADSDTAKKAKDAIEAMYNLIKSFMNLAYLAKGVGADMKKMQDQKRMFDSAKVTASGSVVTITMTGPVESLDDFGKSGGFGK